MTPRGAVGVKARLESKAEAARDAVAIITRVKCAVDLRRESRDANSPVMARDILPTEPAQGRRTPLRSEKCLKFPAGVVKGLWLWRVAFHETCSNSQPVNPSLTTARLIEI